MTRLSLLNDVVFKHVFGTPAGLPVLRALLNALLDLTGDAHIVELQLLNPYLDRENIGQKGGILDIKARDGQGRYYNVEVQVAPERAYVERALYYLARLFGSQLAPGAPYRALAKTVGISLLDFTLFPDQEDLHSENRFYNVRHRRELTDILEVHFIELSKFRGDRPLAEQSRFERWLHVLKFGDLYSGPEDPVPPELTSEEGIEMALSGLREVSASEEVRELIEAREKARHEWASWMDDAEQRGLEKGLEKGRLEMARRMRQEGMTAETTARLTGLSPELLTYPSAKLSAFRRQRRRPSNPRPRRSCASGYLENTCEFCSDARRELRWRVIGGGRSGADGYQ